MAFEDRFVREQRGGQVLVLGTSPAKGEGACVIGHVPPRLVTHEDGVERMFDHVNLAHVSRLISHSTRSRRSPASMVP